MPGLDETKDETFWSWAALEPMECGDAELSALNEPNCFTAAKNQNPLIYENAVWIGFWYRPDLFGNVLGTENFAQLGGAEGLTALIRKHSMHLDKDGKVSPEELEKAAKRQIESYTDMLLNMGVIGALCLSITVPFAVAGIEMNLDGMAMELQLLDSELFADTEHSSWGRWARFTIEYIAQLLFAYAALNSAQASMKCVLFSKRMHTQLAFWMPTPALQKKFIEKTDIRTIMDMEEQALHLLWRLVICGCTFKVSILAGAFSLHLEKKCQIAYAEAQLKSDLICCSSMHMAAHELNKTRQQGEEGSASDLQPSPSHPQPS